jgi:DNA polymerase-3 subunit alpha/error-prone DNA polymerase
MPTLFSMVSWFSLRRGIHSPATLCRAAKRLGYTAVALTDRNNLYGFPAFLDACREHGLRPIAGAEVTGDNAAALLYARGDRGYANLSRIITRRQRDESFSLARALGEHGEDLVVATADVSLIRELHGRLEIRYRMTRPRRAPSWVRDRGIPCLVAPPAVFLSADDIETHRLLRAIDRTTTLARLGEATFGREAFLCSFEAISERFEVFDRALAATVRLGDSLRSRTDFGTSLLPRFSSGRPALELLRRKAFAGAHTRYGKPGTAVTGRLEYELDIIGRKGFAPYFLVVDDIVRRSPRTCGRGSGAASLVAFCLGITNVDPVRYNLMFERFINPGRVDPPDLDIDFAWDERDEVIDYVLKRYGDRAAMVCIHTSFGFRGALRETARVYGITESEISGITKKMPHFYLPGAREPVIAELLRTHPRTRRLHLDPPWPEIISRAQRIVGLPASIGTHPGGVVITPGRIDEYVPVETSAKGVPIIQWEKDGAEQMGLVKIDLLGNRSLAVIRDALAGLREQGIVIDEASWEPARDPETIALMASGSTMGVFYVESPAMRLLQRKVGRGDFEHLVIHSSIIRPAANKYTDEYVRRVRGKPYRFEHPLLKKVLAETYGIMVYQEQVSQVAMALAGFSSQEADALRKVVAKKHRQARLRDFREKFFRGAARNGVAEEVIERIWNMCLSFSGYSFCKPHSASYCRVSYQSAWLKAHHPAAFMAAVIGNYGGFYTTQAYVGEALRLGVKVHSPDVNVSIDRFEAYGMGMRVGLGRIKGVSARAIEAVVGCRIRDGLYRDLADFLRRTGLEEADGRRLVLAGACDTLEPSLNRAQLLWKLCCWYRGGGTGGVATPDLKACSRRELLRAQYRALGFLTEVHPVTLVNPRRRPSGAIKIADIATRVGATVSFLGWGVTSRTITTRYGEGMQFFTFEDETGMVETVLFPEAYQRHVRLLAVQEAFWVTGRVTESFGAIVVEVRRIQDCRL